MANYSVPRSSETFQWDDGIAHKSQDKHDVSPVEPEHVFFNQPLLLIEDVRHSSH
jgi:uncharacterized protein